MYPWLPVLATGLWRHVSPARPRWLARLVADEAAVAMGTESRGASNLKRRRGLGWTPRSQPATRLSRHLRPAETHYGGGVRNAAEDCDSCEAGYSR
jgi:hypothetical protein